MKLLLVVVVVAAFLVAAEAASLGREQCRRGPSYWCSSVQAATSCHAFSHCLKTVWKPQEGLRVHPTKECVHSQKLIKTIRHFLSKEKGLGDAAHLIASTCSFIREDVWRKECKELVTDFWPQTLDLMGSATEPATVAAVMGLCKPLKEAAEKETVGASMECELCQLVVSTVDQLLSENKTEEAVRQALDKVCHKLPSGITWQCLSFVNEYVALVIQLLVQEELSPHQVCLALKLCTASADAEKETVGASVECELCQLVVSTVDQLLLENQTEEAVRQVLDDVCHKLPSGIAGQCLSFVNEYVALLIQLLVQEELAPHQVCLALKLCTASAVSLPRSEPSSRKTSEADCLLCELVINTVIDRIGNNRSEMEVRRALDKVCSMFPSAISSECQVFVDTYTPTLVHLLVQQIKAVDVCKKLGLCSDASKKSKAAPAAAHALTGPSESAGGLCTVCEVVMGMLEEMLARNKSEEDIEKALDQVCSLLPSALASTCKNIVKVYTPIIIDLLEHDYPPSEVCEKIGLCNSTLTVPVALPKAGQPGKASQDPVKCDLCKVIFTEINTLLGDNRSEEAIIKAVEKVCDVLQGDLRLQCQSEVKNYGPAVLDLLQHMDDPAEVCSYLHLCTAASGGPSVKNSSSSLHYNGQQQMLGSKECTWGPSFWCANVENSRKCGMERECVEKYGMKP